MASHATQHSQIIISRKLLEDCQNEIIRIRNIMKYLLGVVGDLTKTDFEQKPVLNYFDNYMVKECEQFLKEINDNYNNFRYNHVVQTVLFFVSNKVSGLYCHCIKDRLYCSPKDSLQRLSAQLVVHTILVSLCKALGPILPHLIEEAWQYHPLKEKPFFFSQKIPVLATKNVDPKLMDTILDIKRSVCVIAKNENLRKYSAEIRLNSDLYEKLNELNFQDGVNDSVLCEILELSSVSLNVTDSENWQIELFESKRSRCLRCRKYNVDNNSDKCVRCEKTVVLL